MGVYIIAEIGINHNNSLENCFKLIDSASKAGCDAVKFQLFSAKWLYPENAGKLDWKDGNATYSYDIYKAVEKFELPFGWIDKLIVYCKEKRIDFISSVFDLSGLDFLIQKQVHAIKLSSYTITNLPLIKSVAKSGLQTFQSTGGATLGETEEAVNTFLSYNDNLTLLHCSIQYPTLLSNCNIGVIKTLQTAFPMLDVGYSDHTIEISQAPVQSVYLGSSVIEKHITLDKNMKGPDHFFALEPDELAKMVKDIRAAEKDYLSGHYEIDYEIFGSSARKCYEHEKYLRNFCFMTLFSQKRIEKGGQIKLQDIKILRPGKKERGLEPKYLSLFNSYKIFAKTNIEIDDPITWESIL
ncbi:N-acetylneuraminate synthase family protein [uncultured Desulfobacter sp.]|uniref:N-acetylneuraminate synthase family protein n=1 Tax=uncultured Desulfobacter sp. TaxID=240139 RepID=UPI002AAB5B13|nr:N-acetylneuraminate synthase family protein [uncultured Desulfobacter sp.]